MHDRLLSKFLSMILALLLIAGGVLFFGPLTLVLTPIAIFLWLEAVVRARRERGQRLLAYLEYAVRLNVPLPAFLRAAAGGEKGGFAARLAHLAQWLEQGSPLADALRVTLPEVSTRHRELVAAAERTGRLGPVLGDLVRQTQPQVRNNPGEGWMSWLYPLLVAYIMGAILLFTFIFVIPKFQEIFADFDTQLPYLTLWLIWLTRGGGMEGNERHWFELFMVLLGIGFVFIWLGSTTVAVEKIVKQPSALQKNWADAWRRLVGRLPIVGAMTRDQQMADVCYTIGSGVEGSLPMPSAIQEAQSLELNPALRHKLEAWEQRVAIGHPVGQAAAEAGLPVVLSEMLGGTQSASNPAQTFSFLHRYYRNRFSRAAELLRGAVVPVTVLLLGAVVGFVVVSLFLPLIGLIERIIQP